MEYEHIVVKADGPITTLQLANPERRNALSLEMMTEVIEALRGLDSSARVVVLAATGPAFSAGHDMCEMIDREPAFYDDLFAICTDMMEMIHDIPQPVIAKVQGIATAAGCQLVASCDLAVAAEDAWFATPGVKIGLFCSTPLVPVSRAVGRKRAMHMLLTGDPISAETALDWGLVNQVVPADKLDEAVIEVAGKILQFSADTIGVGKAAFYAQADIHEHDAYGVTQPIMAGNAASADAQEGMSAFIEKRDPHWAGRA